VRGAAALALDGVSEEDLALLYLDFEAICGLYPIKTKDRGTIDFAPSNWFYEQREFNRTRTGLDLVLKSRQVGFSTLELARDLTFALGNPGTNTLVVGAEKDASDKLFLQLRTMFYGLREHGLAPETKYDNIRELYFPALDSAVRVLESGSSEKAAEKKGRSGTVHRLHSTETAFYEFGTTTMGALLQCVPPNGEIVIESTPNGAQGMFYDLCQMALAGRGQYKLHFWPWTVHAEYQRTPRQPFDPRPRDKVEVQLRGMGATDAQIQWWRDKVEDPMVGLDKALQEYPIDAISCFRRSGRPFLESDAVDWLAKLVRDPVRTDARQGGLLRIHQEPRSDKRYSLGADVSEGVGEDKNAATVVDNESGEVVAYYESDFIAPGDFGVVCAGIGALYNNALVGLERNNHGHAALEALANRAKYPSDRIFRADDEKPGWHTNNATRPVLFDALAQGIRGKTAKSPEHTHAVEARTIIWDKDGKPRAQGKGTKNGSKDDGWISWAIALQVRQRAGRVVAPTSFSIGGL
jgi:hypothetical protein